MLFTNPGRYSLDSAFGLRLPTPLGMLAAAIAAAGVYFGATATPEQQPEAAVSAASEPAHA